MTKSLIVLIIAFLCCCNVKSSVNEVDGVLQCSDAFWNYVTKDLDGSSSFVVLKAKIGKRSENLCLSNTTLFVDLTMRNRIQREFYQEAVKKYCDWPELVHCF